MRPISGGGVLLESSTEALAAFALCDEARDWLCSGWSGRGLPPHATADYFGGVAARLAVAVPENGEKVEISDEEAGILHRVGEVVISSLRPDERSAVTAFLAELAIHLPDQAELSVGAAS